MSRNDVTFSKMGSISNLPVITFRVESGAVASITQGEPVKIGGTGSNYVVLLATGDPEIGTDRMVGIAANDSTDTVAADGVVDVIMPIPNATVMRCAATTVGNIDTDAELLAILNDSVTFDLTGSDFTIDENEGDDPNVHGLMILDGDIIDGTLEFVIKSGAAYGGEI